MDNQQNSNSSSSNVELTPKEELLQKADPIEVDIDDELLVKIINKRLKDSKDYFSKPEIDLYNRRKKNIMYLFGRQVEDKVKRNQLKIYQTRYLDNVLYEIESSLKPLAMSRLPDLIVTPGQQGDEAQKTADDISKVINTQIKTRQNRQALGIAFKHRPAYFVGVIKCRWVPERNDFIFEPVHPDYIEVDHTCQSNNADDMWLVAETRPVTVQELFIRFPDKKEDIIRELANDNIVIGDNGKFSDEALASQVKIKEIWFDWKKPVKKGGSEEEQEQFEEVSGTIWKYRKCIMMKCKNPNYDWEGQEKVYVYDDPSDETTKREPSMDEMMMAAMTGQPMPNMSKEKVYRNYFEYPRKPYFFMGYDQWHEMPYDATSELEQNIRSQEGLDDTGRRVMDKLKSRRKHIFAAEGGMTPEVLESMDLDDPMQDIILKGKIGDVHTTIEPEVPTAQEFNFMSETRDRMYAVSGATAIRGDLQSDVATSNQIAREGNYTRADDVVEDTINAACEWMADWSLQMIKLRYTDYHFKKILGAKGVAAFIKLKGDMIDDGMEVIMKASGTDKQRIKNQAMDMAKLQMTDPLSFYRDLGVDDPEGRAEKLLTLQTNPSQYLAQFVMNMGNNLQDLGNTLNGQPPQMPPQASAPMPPGAPPVPPQGPSPLDTGAAPVEPPQGVTASPQNGIM